MHVLTGLGAIKRQFVELGARDRVGIVRLCLLKAHGLVQLLGRSCLRYRIQDKPYETMALSLLNERSDELFTQLLATK